MNFLAKIILWKFSLLYRLAIAIWNIYYRFSRQVKFPVRVISVGNITVGGTGKTPVVRYIANLAVKAGYKTAVVARGYKRKSKGLIEVSDNSTAVEVGDEPLEIYRLTENVRVYVHESKTIAAAKAFQDNAEVIIVDDGFQHRRLYRDIDLVCLDWKRPFGPGGMLPLGRLREPESRLKRANMLLYTSYDDKITPDVKIESDQKSFCARSQIKSYLNIKTGVSLSSRELAGMKILAFCGLANPEKFLVSLIQTGLNIAKLIPLPDHYHYHKDDIDKILSEVKNAGADCLITTYKDAVKIDSYDFGNLNVYSAMLEIEIVDGNGNDNSEAFKQALGL